MFRFLCLQFKWKISSIINDWNTKNYDILISFFLFSVDLERWQKQQLAVLAKRGPKGAVARIFIIHSKSKLKITKKKSNLLGRSILYSLEGLKKHNPNFNFTKFYPLFFQCPEWWGRYYWWSLSLFGSSCSCSSSSFFGLRRRSLLLQQ